jgi:membrane-associated phospholipid phosphatase
MSSKLNILVALALMSPAWAQDPLPSDTPAAEETAQNPDTPQPQQLVDKEHANPLQDPRDRVYYPGDTERFKPLMEKLGGNVLLDQKAIWTSPFHMRKQDAKWWVGIGAATAAFIATDQSNALQPTPSTVSFSNGASNIGTSYTLAPLLAGFYGYGVFRNDPKAREVGVLGTEALIDTLIVSAVLKPIAGRNRPDAPNEPGNFFEGGTGFPSGHAMQSWAVASILSYEYGHTKWVPVVAIGLATVVSTARFTAQRHYASDIVAGGAMGWFIGRYVWKTHQDHAIHPHSKITAALLPQLSPSTATYGVIVELRKTR